MLVAWAAWLALMAGVNVATPLYPVYASQYGFSELVLTAVFAVYAIVLVPALVLFGRLSDRFGRRAVMLAGLATGCVSLVVFAASQGAGWLFASRALQGLAVGMISGAATAGLVEWEPTGGGQRPAFLAGLAQAAGSGTGPLVAGILAQWAPAPLRTPYLVFLALTLLGGVATACLLPRPAADFHPEPWRLQRPRLPEDRPRFARVSITAGLCWATVALFLSIVPSYAAQLLHTSNLALFGLLAAMALAASSVAQVGFLRLGADRGWGTRRSQAAGLVLLAAGLLALVTAAPTGSLPLLLIAACAAGVGHGVGFLNAQHELNLLAPENRRGEVTAAFIACVYVAVATATLATGALAQAVSLTTAVVSVGAVLAAGCLSMALWQAAEGGDRRYVGRR